MTRELFQRVNKEALYIHFVVVFSLSVFNRTVTVAEGAICNRVHCLCNPTDLVRYGQICKFRPSRVAICSTEYLKTYHEVFSSMHECPQ